MSMHSPIASLPMYDWPEVQPYYDQFWQDISCHLMQHGICTPPYLTRLPVYSETWFDHGLVLGQTCGYPYANMLKGKVRYLATPVYDLEGCGEGTYSSAILVRNESELDQNHLAETNFDELTFAYNSNTSWSGYHVMAREYGDLNQIFAGLVESGGHRFSAKLVADGKADCCALDAVCWSMLQLFEPQTADKLKVAGWTGKRPALPFITSLQTPDHHAVKIVEAIQAVIDDPAHRENCGQLGLTGCVVLSGDAYDGFAD